MIKHCAERLPCRNLRRLGQPSQNYHNVLLKTHHFLIQFLLSSTSTMDKGPTIRSNGIILRRQPSEDIRTIAKEIAMDIIYHTSKKSKKNINNKMATTTTSSSNSSLFAWPVCTENHRQTMRRTVEEITQKHEIVYGSIVKKLEVTEGNMEAVFVNIVTEIFKDKQYNWGRIVSVYAFGGRLAKYAWENGITSDIDFIGEFMGNYVADKLGWWIEANGGWDAFVDYFPEPLETRIEQNLWKGLLCTAGVGLAALAAVVVVR